MVLSDTAMPSKRDGRDKPGHDNAEQHPFVPAKAGTQGTNQPDLLFWIPACAGMNGVGRSLRACKGQHRSWLRSPMASEFKDRGIGLAIRRVDEALPARNRRPFGAGDVDGFFRAIEHDE